MPETNFPSLSEDEQSYGTAEFMDPELYRATTEGDILEFIRAMETSPADGSHYNPPATCVQLGPQKNTVLHIATNFEHYEIVKLVCKDLPYLAAEKNAKGDTALHIAARSGNSWLVALLLDCDHIKEVLSEQNEDGNTALHEALCCCCEEVPRMLIDKDRNVSYSVNKEGKSLLYLAAEAGYASIVRLLLENPVGNYSIGGSSKYNSPVHAAILGRNIDVLKVLWEKYESSFHMKCEEGRNPLHYATYIGFVEGVNFLLNKSCAFAYQRDKHGLFPIHIASSEGHTAIIQDMLCHCPDSRELLTLEFHNILHVAAKSGKAKAVSFMLKMFELQKLLNERDGDGNTPLHVATIYANAETVSTLTWDERVNLELENNESFTALDIAEKYMETAESFRKMSFAT
ncbi:protein ACCELERATED CELL DEATH 6-like [Cornus florida]|uniref:protein ACCELERATED CELL DEATH 6-like n=1 Tax=Cornus florida TaxID=4283 RepID=UPI0028A0DB47|nr:protein ACCELERATED CELL DEATH 6-like [Cornus florida]